MGRQRRAETQRERTGGRRLSLTNFSPLPFFFFLSRRTLAISILHFFGAFFPKEETNRQRRKKNTGPVNSSLYKELNLSFFSAAVDFLAFDP